MSQRNGTTPKGPGPRRSASAESAALRRGFVDESGFEPPPRLGAGGDGLLPRSSAHAEAAALRWYEQHADLD